MMQLGIRTTIPYVRYLSLSSIHGSLALQYLLLALVTTYIFKGSTTICIGFYKIINNIFLHRKS